MLSNNESITPPDHVFCLNQQDFVSFTQNVMKYVRNSHHISEKMSKSITYCASNINFSCSLMIESYRIYYERIILQKSFINHIFDDIQRMISSAKKFQTPTTFGRPKVLHSSSYQPTCSLFQFRGDVWGGKTFGESEQFHEEFFDRLISFNLVRIYSKTNSYTVLGRMKIESDVHSFGHSPAQLRVSKSYSALGVRIL